MSHAHHYAARAAAVVLTTAAVLVMFVVPGDPAAAEQQVVSLRSELPVEAPEACAATRFVSPSGDDAADGSTTATPWRTISRVNAAQLTPGMCVLFEGGYQFPGSLQILAADASTVPPRAADAGSAALPVTIGSYGPYKATILSGGSDGIIVVDTAGVVVQDLYIVGDYLPGTHHGINVFNGVGGGSQLEGVTIQRVDVQGFGRSGVIIGGGDEVTDSKSGFRAVTVRDSDLHDNGDSGLQFYGRNCEASRGGYSNADVYVVNVAAFDNRGVPDKFVTGCDGLPEQTNSGNGILLGDVERGTVEHSFAFRNGANNNFEGGGPVGIWTYDSTEIAIQFNVSFSNRSQTKDGGGFDIDGGVSNSVLQYNYSYDNDGPGYLVYQYEGADPLVNNVIRYNISRNDARRGDYGAITIGSNDPINGAQDTYVYGNTIYMTPTGRPGEDAAGVRVWDRTTGALFLNNSIHVSGSIPLVSIEAGASAELYGNNYAHDSGFLVLEGGANYSDIGATAYTSRAGWRAATGRETVGNVDSSLEVDPGYWSPAVTSASTWIDPNNFGLLSTSVLRGAGVDPSWFGLDAAPRDFFGVTVPSAVGPYSIGASQGG